MSWLLLISTNGSASPCTSKVGGSSGDTCRIGDTDALRTSSKSNAGEAVGCRRFHDTACKEEAAVGERRREVLVWRGPGPEIHGRVVRDHRGHVAADAQHFVLRGGVAVVGGQADHEGEVATRAAAVDAKAIRVDSVGVGMETHEPDRTAHVRVRFRHLEARTATVPNGENRKPPAQERFVPWSSLFGGHPPRDPATAYHIENANTVGFGRREHIERQRHPVLMAIDHVRDDRAAGLSGNRGGQATQCQQPGRHSGQPSHGRSPSLERQNPQYDRLTFNL